MNDLAFDFLLDGSHRPEDLATELRDFLGSATRSLDVAIYDFQARTGATAAVADALEAAAGRGVSVRVAFNVERRSSSGIPAILAGSRSRSTDWTCRRGASRATAP